MQPIEALIDRVERLQTVLTDGTLIQRVIKRHVKDIVALNTDEQLFQRGILATGAPVTPHYRPRTIRYKRRHGQPYDRVTLRDKGRFHSKFKVILNDEDFTIDSDEPNQAKYDYLTKKYSNDIFGLTDEHKGLVGEWIKDAMKDEIPRILRLQTE